MHRPSDLMRLLVGVLAVVVLLAIAAFAHGTTSGLEQDITKGTGQAPDLFIKIAGLASSIAILLVPVAFAIERLIKRDGLRIADGVLAAVLAHGCDTRHGPVGRAGRPRLDPGGAHPALPRATSTP
ncbi:hypothetical protein GCM10019016_082590 [Streptomyces prasinosporus]|uniref:Uncharacterized protein n=1 Tax=Streptomyces prasinosporus TaxID=68256 RepID=A0ABP6U168_9ACTN